MADGISSVKVRLSSQLVMDIALSQILFRPLENETPGSRLRQFGMMAILLDLHLKGEPLTLTSIVDTTGMTRGAAQEVLHSLEWRRLVRSEWMTNSIGRGKARIYFLPRATLTGDLPLPVNVGSVAEAGDQD